MVPEPEPVTLSRLEYTQLRLDAMAWRLLNRSTHVAALLAEWMEWDRRRQLRESSWGVSSLARGRWDHVSYAEIERRRASFTQPARSAEEVRKQALDSWAEVERQIRKKGGAA
jgi:hypothetical protein